MNQYSDVLRLEAPTANLVAKTRNLQVSFETDSNKRMLHKLATGECIYFTPDVTFTADIPSYTNIAFPGITTVRGALDVLSSGYGDSLWYTDGTDIFSLVGKKVFVEDLEASSTIVSSSGESAFNQLKVQGSGASSLATVFHADEAALKLLSTCAGDNNLYVVSYGAAIDTLSGPDGMSLSGSALIDSDGKYLNINAYNEIYLCRRNVAKLVIDTNGARITELLPISGTTVNFRDCGHTLAQTGLAHGITDVLPTDCAVVFSANMDGTNPVGGVNIIGCNIDETYNGAGVSVVGILGQEVIGDQRSAIVFQAAKYNGATDIQALADTDMMVTFKNNGVTKAKVYGDGSTVIKTLNMTGVPTSTSGLVSGDVWSDGGILKIIA